MSQILILGASGYIGRYLVPVLASSADFEVTAVSSNPSIATLFSDLSDRVETQCLSLDDFPLDLAQKYDAVVNLACTGVAHQGLDDPSVLMANSRIAHQVCLLAAQTRHSLLLHLGSDMELSHVSFYSTLCADQGADLRGHQAEPSYYVLSKLLQTGIIRLNSSRLHFHAHVILTPNIYGGDDPPGSLMGAMRAAAASGLPFTIRNPSAVKRFIHVNSFAYYVNALLHHLLAPAVGNDSRHSFHLSSVDFVPSTTVRAFACHQWEHLSSDSSCLRFNDSD